MTKNTWIRVSVCALFITGFLYAYIHHQNQLTKLRLKIPIVAQELKELLEEKTHLQYEVDAFENPQHLMELAKKPQYRHLKYPRSEEIITLS